MGRCATHPVKTPERSSCRASAGSCTAQAGRWVARQSSQGHTASVSGLLHQAAGQQIALPSAAAAKWLATPTHDATPCCRTMLNLRMTRPMRISWSRAASRGGT